MKPVKEDAAENIMMMNIENPNGKRSIMEIYEKCDICGQDTPNPISHRLTDDGKVYYDGIICEDCAEEIGDCGFYNGE